MVKGPAVLWWIVGSVALVLPAAWASASSVAGFATTQPAASSSGLLALGQSRRAQTRKSAILKMGEHQIALAHPLTNMKSTEFAELDALENGGVVRFFSAPALRLRNDVSLNFGEQLVPVGNVAPDFDGIYSVWIRKTDGGGWELVFNDQGDVWGSQHDPAADRLAVPLQHELAAELEEIFTVDLSWEPEDARGALVLAWGAHRWSASFTLN